MVWPGLCKCFTLTLPWLANALAKCVAADLAWLRHAPVLYGHAVRFGLQCNTCLKEARVVSLPCLCRALLVSVPCLCRVLAVFLLSLCRVGVVCVFAALSPWIFNICVMRLLCYCRVLAADLLYVGSSTALAARARLGCACAMAVFSRCTCPVLFQPGLSAVLLERALDGPVAFEPLQARPQNKSPWCCKTMQ